MDHSSTSLPGNGSRPSSRNSRSSHFQTGGGSYLASDESQTAGYRRGTRILTDQGEARIETLRIGDSVRTQSGHLKPIRWIGRRSYGDSVASGNWAVLPIRVRRGAMSDGLPRRDLWVSPAHGLCVDGVLVPARALVNGGSIVQERSAIEVSYFHLEFDTHELIFAEGQACESYVNDDDRAQFDNALEYAVMYPGRVGRPPRYCVPRLKDGEALRMVQTRLRRRQEMLLSRADALAHSLLQTDLANNLW